MNVTGYTLGYLHTLVNAYIHTYNRSRAVLDDRKNTSLSVPSQFTQCHSWWWSFGCCSLARSVYLSVLKFQFLHFRCDGF